LLFGHILRLCSESLTMRIRFLDVISALKNH